MPERIDFWGIPQPWGPVVIYAVLGLAALVMLVRFAGEFAWFWRSGRAERHWNRPMRRLGRALEYTFLQTKILTQRYPGWMHLCLAGSFFVFFLGTALATINGHVFRFLVGSPYLVYKLALDLFTLVFLVGLGLAGYRRWVQRPPRLTLRKGFTLALVFLSFIVFNGLLVTSLRLAILKPAWAAWAPVSWGLAQLWLSGGAPAAVLQGWHLGLYTLHVLSIAVFFVALPVGTLAHILTAPLNVFFADDGLPDGVLSPVQGGISGQRLYAGVLGGLSWRQMLQTAACTECGRCQEVCPAYAAGQPLNPKQVILDLRGVVQRGRKQGALLPITAAGDALGIRADAAWACTTCLACTQVCPVSIDPASLLVDVRRGLVEGGQLDGALQRTLENLALYGNSTGEAGGARARWAQPLAATIADARTQPVEYLWLVGDTASYSPVTAEATRAAASVFQAAGLNFGLLYADEHSAGNDARRVGEEGLYWSLVRQNAAALAGCDFQALVTTDPHTYHALKNEYPAEVLKGRPVLHYTELLDQLFASGRLQVARKLDYVVTYHDPCYLGRYNGIYAAPRRVLERLGCRLVEMPRNREASYCCGAGGGRLWMKEGQLKERPSQSRIREALSLPGVTHFVVTCPKDLVMYRDAVETLGPECTLRVVDLAELVQEAQ